MPKKTICIGSLKLWMLSLIFSGWSRLSLHAQEGRGNDRLEIYPDALQYLVIGDWGMGNIRQKEVAAQMAKISQQVSVDFVVTTGDNFYPNGVSSERDTLWKHAFERVYTAPSLKVPWYPVLGNHDYGGDPEAQVRYSKISDRWKMPSRYYRQIFPIEGDTTMAVMLLFIDTTPLIPSNYGRGLAVNGRDTTAQLQWIAGMLSEVPRNVIWTFVIGHHPVYTAGERSNNAETNYTRRVLQPLFDRYNVTAYLSGHEHNLQHIRGADGLHQFVSGAGSDTRIINPFVPRRFARSATGFMLFSVMKDKIIVQVISKRGRVLYRYRILPAEAGK